MTPDGLVAAMCDVVPLHLFGDSISMEARESFPGLVEEFPGGKALLLAFPEAKNGSGVTR